MIIVLEKILNKKKNHTIFIEISNNPNNQNEQSHYNNHFTHINKVNNNLHKKQKQEVH